MKILLVASLCSCVSSVRTLEQVTLEHASRRGDCPVPSHEWPQQQTLSEYTPEQLQDSLKDTRLLLLLQRDLLRVERLKEMMPKDDFEKLFPLDFVRQKLQSNITWAAGWGVVNLASFGLPAFSLIGKATTAATTAAGVLDFWTWAKDYYRLEARQLTESGANSGLEYWDDVPLGLLEDVYVQMLPVWRYWHAPEMVLFEKTVMTHANNSDKLFQSAILRPGSGVERILETEANRQKVRMLNQLEGWIPLISIQPQGWYVRDLSSSNESIEDQRIPIHSAPGEFDYIGEILPGEMVKVRDSYEWFDRTWLQLADGRGWAFQYNDQGNLLGPYSREDASKLAIAKLRIDMDKALESLEPTLKSRACINSMNRYWSSSVSQFAKLLVAGALVAAGPVTHGLTWALASGISVGSAGVDITLATSIASTVVDFVTHTIGALANFERYVFSGKSTYLPCNETQQCQDFLCPEEDRANALNGHVCMRHGVFVRQGHDGYDGYCVPRPRKLMPSGQTCATDIDCESGTCFMARTGSHDERMNGQCA